MKTALRLSLFLALSFAFLTPLMAQLGTGKITGLVLDKSNALIPGVTVTLTSPSIMGTRTFATDERGSYQFDLLPPGVYAVKFELPGFKTLIREELQITAGFTATINAELEVATVAETVTVTGESPVVNLESSTLSTNFTTSLLQNLPNGRDIWSTLAQTPGIVMTLHDVGGSQAGNYSPYRTYGTANGSEDFLMLDGVRYNYMYLDYGSYEEMQVVAASKSAEARNAGAYMNAIVKTGGNDIHSMVYAGFTPESFKGSNLNDKLRGFGLTTTNKLTFFSDLNGNVGGPIKKDRMWWFFSARDNYIGNASPGYTKAGCSTAVACTGKPVGTFINDETTEQGPFYTRLENVTLKLNTQITPKNQFLAFANFSDKRYPFRGGNGASAGFFNSDSVARQTYPGWIYKLQWTSILNNRITLDTSFNRNGYHWPNDRRVDEYSIRDLDTQQVRGGYSGSGTGFTSQFPQTFDPTDYQYNLTLSMATDHFIAGSHNAKIGYSSKHETVTTKVVGTVGEIVLYYRGGFKTPAFIETLDAPFTTGNGLRENSFFIQDTWKVTRRLTINPGLRFDRAVSFYPEQVKSGAGPFQSPLTVPRRDVATVQAPVLRLSFVYDVFGNGKTALKGSYGRYNIDAGGTEEPGVASAANPMGLTKMRYTWTGSQPAADCYLRGCSFNPAGQTPVNVTGGNDRSVDASLKFPYVDEYTAGVDQQLMTDLSLRLNFVQKFDKDRWQIFNTAIPFAAYDIPVTGVDPGRPGLSPRNLTFYSLERPYVGTRKDLIANNPSLDNTNTTFEASIVKRFSKKWQLITGWDYLMRKVWTQSQVAGDSTGFAQNPNNLIYNNGEHFNTWTYKVMGTYQAPFGLTLSSVFRSAKGGAYGRRLNSPSLNQGVVTLYVEPIGTFFMDTVKLLDVRAEKSFMLSDRNKLGVIFDLFNSLNTAAVTGINDLTGTSFGVPTQTLEPRTVRVSMRYTF